MWHWLTPANYTHAGNGLKRNFYESPPKEKEDKPGNCFADKLWLLKK